MCQWDYRLFDVPFYKLWRFGLNKAPIVFSLAIPTFESTLGDVDRRWLCRLVVVGFLDGKGNVNRTTHTTT
jgi:hypothetical protein